MTQTEPNWEGVRAGLRAEALANGVSPEQLESVVELSIRRRQAEVRGEPFQYEDVERELEDLYRVVGAAPGGIQRAKETVWEIARENHARLGGDLNEHLFACFNESLNMHRQYLAWQRQQPAYGLFGRQRGQAPGGLIFFDGKEVAPSQAL